MDLNIPDLKSAPTGGTVQVTDGAFDRLAEISESSGETKMLRVAVLGGGCSGFSYEFALEDHARDEDLVIERNGHRVLIDPESLPFLAGSVIDFKDELIGARFAVDNPNATSTCGCGTSFSL
ncbi:MAG: iron-sulfur cluster insertion protein ErpA [Pseudomonadota bacterium]